MLCVTVAWLEGRHLLKYEQVADLNSSGSGASVRPSGRRNTVQILSLDDTDKGRPIRLLKDLSSARDKIERIYGLNKEKLLLLAKVKEGFETRTLFDLIHSENLIQPDSPYFVCLFRPCKFWKQCSYNTFLGYHS
ncbi:CMF_collapsed_G0013370.mRNA.1.CDS.1 [Saccharomyces cerevisiae]|nr:CMF_collapsed_G0013370.mRNA.1.CDS.1 [Saccharomyces cerevisiae]